MKVSNVVAMLSVAALSVAVLAQGPQGGPGGGRRGGGMMGMGRRMDPKQQSERMTGMLTQMLTLTPAQQAKVKAITLKAATDMKKIRDAQDAAIKKVLTADQQKKMATLGRGGMGGPGGRPGMGRP